MSIPLTIRAGTVHVVFLYLLPSATSWIGIQSLLLWSKYLDATKSSSIPNKGYGMDMHTVPADSSRQRLAQKSTCLTWPRILDPAAMLKFENELRMLALFDWNYSLSLVAQPYQPDQAPVSILSSHQY
ncbi:hypothetical protein V8C34DRAFT_214073 [Trichoderma compactum]